jgi:hypothetical protein
MLNPAVATFIVSCRPLRWQGHRSLARGTFDPTLARCRLSGRDFGRLSRDVWLCAGHLALDQAESGKDANLGTSRGRFPGGT